MNTDQLLANFVVWIGPCLGTAIGAHTLPQAVQLIKLHKSLSAKVVSVINSIVGGLSYWKTLQSQCKTRLIIATADLGSPLLHLFSVLPLSAREQRALGRAGDQALPGDGHRQEAALARLGKSGSSG